MAFMGDVEGSAGSSGRGLDLTRPLTPAQRRQIVDGMEQRARQVRQQVAQRGSAGPLFGIDAGSLVTYSDQRPVFVLGEARSGTSAMLWALRDAAGFFAWDEGHLLAALPTTLFGLRTAWQRRLGAINHPTGRFACDHLDLGRVQRAIVQEFCETYARAARQAGAARWADKTPNTEAILAVPLLAHLYPRAAFVFMHRHPIKLLLSRQRKFPHLPLQMGSFHCAATLRLWLEIRQSLKPGQFVEVAQAEMALRSDEVVRSLAPVLDLTGAEVAAMAKFFAEHRPESTQSSDDASDVYLEDLTWPEEEKQFLLDLCESPAAAFGYRLRRSGSDDPSGGAA